MQRRWARVDRREHEDKILLLLALVVSAGVGLIVVGFVAVTERMGRVLLTAGGVQRVLSPLVGSLVGGWLLFKYFPDARGSGIPQTRVALVLQNGIISVRTVIGKFICSSISLGSGVALGREGPSVHIGAGIASAAGRRLGLSEEQVQSLIPVGTAAAVAAAFNAPLAAVLFTLEEILADLHARVVGSVVRRFPFQSSGNRRHRGRPQCWTGACTNQPSTRLAVLSGPSCVEHNRGDNKKAEAGWLILLTRFGGLHTEGGATGVVAFCRVDGFREAAGRLSTRSISGARWPDFSWPLC